MIEITPHTVAQLLYLVHSDPEELQEALGELRAPDIAEALKELPPEASSWRKPAIADPAKFKQLQARAAQLAKTTPDDKSLKNSQQLLAALPRSCVIPYETQDELQARQAIAQQAQAKQSGSKSSK